MSEANDFLMSGGVPAAQFTEPGTEVSGVITSEPKVRQQTDLTTGAPLTWDDGSPKYQVIVTVDTGQIDPEREDDDGLRNLYVKGQMQAAVRQAVRRAKCRGLEVGATLSVTYTGNGKPPKRGFNPPKEYSAVYRPPVVEIPADKDDEPGY